MGYKECMENEKKVSRGSLDGICKVARMFLGRCSEDVLKLMKFGGCLEGV